MRKKWKVKRGYLKIHLAVDAKSKQAVSMEVTEETVSDGSQTEPLVQEAVSKNDVERALGDGAYDSRANFNLLASNEIDPAIKVRKNASRKAKGSYARKMDVIAQQTDFEAWKKRERDTETDGPWRAPSHASSASSESTSRRRSSSTWRRRWPRRYRSTTSSCR